MKNGEKLLALLLALVMVFALCACGSGTDRSGEDEEEELSESSRRAGRRERDQSEPAAEAEPTPEPSPEQQLAGTWAASWDLTEMLSKELDESMGDVEVRFTDYLTSPFELDVVLEISEDMNYHMYTDGSRLGEMAAGLQEAMKGYLNDAILAKLKITLAESGVDTSGVSTMAEMEELMGTTLEELLGTSLDETVASFVNEEMLSESYDTLDESGTVSVEGDTLRFDGEEMTYTLDGDTLTLDGDDGGVGMLPLTFHRVA